MANTTTRPKPISDAEEFQSECHNMLEWLGTIEMPEDRVGIHEAGGNLGGILVSLMTTSAACFYTEESANVFTLCGYLKESEKDKPNWVAILETIQECAGEARDQKADIEVTFN